MTDISITAANVTAGSNAQKERGTAGATITAGQRVYLDPADGKYKLADNNGASELVRRTRGIALNSASDGQPMEIQKLGDITIGATLTAGTTYYASDTPGGICPLADVESGEYFEIIGIAKSATVLAMQLNYSGVSA